MEQHSVICLKQLLIVQLCSLKSKCLASNTHSKRISPTCTCSASEGQGASLGAAPAAALV
eukprot:scaffold223412_cov18-Tisochrysis_lutea.AAC.1